MSDCCSTNSPQPQPTDVRLSGLKRPACPTNGKPGRRVDRLTVKALLARPLDVLGPGETFFCPDPDCPTVYYTSDGQTFAEGDLRERVYQKHPNDADVLVCYCFQHTRGAIQADARENGRSEIAERITAGVQAGQCACEVRNPQGSCCLGNVRAEVKRVL